MNFGNPDVEIPGIGRRKLSWLLSSQEGQTLLAKLHPHQQRKRLNCTCTGADSKNARLVIRRRETRYHIARMPGTGHFHLRNQCEFYSSDQSDSGAGEYAGAIKARGEITEIKVNFPLCRSTAVVDAEPGVSSDSASGRIARGSMGLSGLLCHLWGEAGLNAWPGQGGRTWAEAHSNLRSAAIEIELGRRKLLDHLYLQPDSPRPWLPATPHNVAESKNYFLVLFKVSSIFLTPFGGAYVKSTMQSDILFKKGLLDAVRFSYPRVWPFFENSRPSLNCFESGKPPKVVCLALVNWESVKGKPCLVASRAAIMLTSWRDIPVESSYELRIADMLVRERRAFSKPMRFDSADDVVYPDFLLHDVAGSKDLPMEIYGVRGNDKYEERKVKKQMHYRGNNRLFWEWTPPEPIPPFPLRWTPAMSSPLTLG